MNDQERRRARGFIAWGVFGLIVLVAASIIASLLFFGPRSSGTFYPFFLTFLFPFHFGWLGGIFIILLVLLIAGEMEICLVPIRGLMMMVHIAY